MATYSSFMPVARSSAVASTRVSAADAAGLLDGRAAGARAAPQRGLGGGGQRGDVDAGLGDQAAGGAVLLAQQRDQQVDRLGGGVPGRGRGQLGGLDRLAAAGGELLGTELAHTDCRSLVSCGLVSDGSSRAGEPHGASTGTTVRKLSLFHSTSPSFGGPRGGRGRSHHHDQRRRAPGPAPDSGGGSRPPSPPSPSASSCSRPSTGPPPPRPGRSMVLGHWNQADQHHDAQEHRPRPRARRPTPEGPGPRGQQRQAGQEPQRRQARRQGRRGPRGVQADRLRLRRHRAASAASPRTLPAQPAGSYLVAYSAQFVGAAGTTASPNTVTCHIIVSSAFGHHGRSPRRSSPRRQVTSVESPPAVSRRRHPRSLVRRRPARPVCTMSRPNQQWSTSALQPIQVTLLHTDGDARPRRTARPDRAALTPRATRDVGPSLVSAPA